MHRKIRRAFLNYNHDRLMSVDYGEDPGFIEEREAKYWALRKWRKIKQLGFRPSNMTVGIKGFRPLNKYIHACPYCSVFKLGVITCSAICPIIIDNKTCTEDNHPYKLIQLLPKYSKEFRTACDEIITAIKATPVIKEPKYFRS